MSESSETAIKAAESLRAWLRRVLALVAAEHDRRAAEARAML